MKKAAIKLTSINTGRTFDVVVNFEDGTGVVSVDGEKMDLDYRNMRSNFGQNFIDIAKSQLRTKYVGATLVITREVSPYGSGILTKCTLNGREMDESIAYSFVQKTYAGTYTVSESIIKNAKKDNTAEIMRAERNGDWSTIFSS